MGRPRNGFQRVTAGTLLMRRYDTYIKAWCHFGAKLLIKIAIINRDVLNNKFFGKVIFKFYYVQMYKGKLMIGHVLFDDELWRWGELKIYWYPCCICMRRQLISQHSYWAACKSTNFVFGHYAVTMQHYLPAMYMKYKILGNKFLICASLSHHHDELWRWGDCVIKRIFLSPLMVNLNNPWCFSVAVC